MLRIISKSTICLIANLHPLHAALTLDYLFMMVILYLIHMVTEAWLGLSIISLSQGLTFPLQFIKSANTCQHLPPFILLQLKEFFITLKALFIMASNSLMAHYHYLPTLMQIGLVTQMTKDPLLVFSSIWDPMSLLGLLRSSLLYLDPPLSQSIELSHLPQLSYVGFELFLKTLVFTLLILQSYGVIMFLPQRLLPIQSSMPEPNLLKLIFTLCENEFFAKILLSNLSLQLISLLISSLKVFPLIGFLIFKTTSLFQFLYMSLRGDDEDTAKATELQCRLSLSIKLHDCSLDTKISLIKEARARHVPLIQGSCYASVIAVKLLCN